MKIKRPEFRFNNPMSEAHLDEMIGLLEIEQDDLIVDIGGGNGSVLLKMLSLGDCNGVLVEINKMLLETCAEHGAPLIADDKLKLIDAKAEDALSDFSLNSIDILVCIGSSHALGGYLELIEKTLPYIKEDGCLLIGEGFWKKQPDQEYLDLLGDKEEDMKYHHELIALPERLGLRYLYCHTASEADWNHFEGKYFLSEELKAQTLEDSERATRLLNLRKFRNIQYQYGRSNMGFGLYLFQKR